jgi:Zn-dependent peptidase ImmA (M78 family)
VSPVPSRFEEAQARAASDAHRFLSRFWLGRIPVDPFQLARQNGLKVINTTFADNSIAGALRKEFGRRPEILLNERDGRARQRFTCAHELGHYVWNGEGDDGEYQRIDHRDSLSSTGVYIEEVYANVFAAEVLMPEQHVRVMCAEDLFDWEMAQRFAVSRQVIRYRLRSLGLAP